MSSFTHEQVAYFKQVFNQFSDEDAGGVTGENFAAATLAGLDGSSTAGRRPSAQYLDNEFQRIAGDSGVVQWQQFFQVLVHLNLDQSESPPPPEVPRHRTESGARVQFAPIQDDTEPPPPSYDMVQDQEEARSNTLGRQLLRSVGNFFGVTETSQRGGDGQIGWEQFNERSLEEPGLFATLSRRASLRHNLAENQVPGYPAIATGRSFDLDELGGDSDEEDELGLTSAPPPAYSDVIGAPPTSGLDQMPVVQRQSQEQHYPEPTHPSSQRQQRQPVRQLEDLIYNKEEAWQYYQKYVKAERRLRQRRHRTDAYEFFGTADGGVVSSDGGGGNSSSLRRGRLNSADGSSGVVRRPKKNKRTKLQRQSTLIRTEVESLPSFWPVFIVLVSVAQVLTVVVLLSIYGLAPIHVFPVKMTEEFDSLSTISTVDNISYYRAVNLWIGPSPLNLIQLGAKFTPCMRRDFGILRRNGRIYVNDQSNFGCCQNQGLVGTTLISRCVSPNPLSPSNITFFTREELCSNRSVAGPPTFHPCCISITGHCEVMRLDECTARGGFYHEEEDNCQDVNCFRDICGFNELLVSELNDNDGNPDPISPNPQQFWRFFTSIFMHLGVIHLIIIIPIQLYVGIKIERTIGWLRIGIIYIVSGVGGNLISAIFITYGVNAGASGAVFGLLGVLYVELFQFWQIVDRAWLELIKLTAFVIFLLALGTLPYVDNMSHIGGLLFGVPTAIIFVPYITFGKWDAARKRILLIICIPLLLAMFLFGFLTFYIIPDNSFCSFCHYINCVPYTPQLCPEEFTNPNPSVFSL